MVLDSGNYVLLTLLQANMLYKKRMTRKIHSVV